MSDSDDNTVLRARDKNPVLLIPVVIILILIWGSAFTLVGAAVRTLSPDWLVAYRLGTGAFVIYIYSRLTGHRLPPLRDKRWLWYSIMAVTAACLPFALFAHGQKSIDSGLTAIIAGTMPLMTIILAHFFTTEKLTFWKFAGFALGFAGIVILFLPEKLSLTLIENWQAQFLILLAAFSYALTTILAARAPETPAAVATSMMLIIGTVISTLWAMVVAGPPPIPETTALLCAIGLGVGSTGIATVIYLWLVDLRGPSYVARLNYFIPPCAIVLGVLFLSEDLNWRMSLSFIVILIGLMVSRISSQAKSLTP